jgi:hypothetical protein
VVEDRGGDGWIGEEGQDAERVVAEAGLSFRVNLSDYLDTKDARRPRRG